VSGRRSPHPRISILQPISIETPFLGLAPNPSMSSDGRTPRPSHKSLADGAPPILANPSCNHFPSTPKYPPLHPLPLSSPSRTNQSPPLHPLPHHHHREKNILLSILSLIVPIAKNSNTSPGPPLHPLPHLAHRERLNPFIALGAARVRPAKGAIGPRPVKGAVGV
jgi:hypothetical protein